MNKYFVTTLKIGFSVAILGFLVWKARQENLFEMFLAHEKNWGLIALAGCAALATLFIQIFRWTMLANSLKLKLTAWEACRLVFISQLFSLIGVGILGGDALKTYFLGSHNKGRMTEAFTSVFVDRLIGLIGLVIIAGFVSLWFDVNALDATSATERDIVINLCRLARWGSIACFAFMGFVMIPGMLHWSFWNLLEKLPLAGKFFHKLIAALRMYREQPLGLFAALFMSFFIHLLNASVYYCLSHALPAYANDIAIEKPSFVSHIMAALLALATGALPVGGLEIVFNIMYRAVSHPTMPKQQGFLIVLAFRLLQMGIASIGLYFYIRGRREVDELLHEAEVNAETKTDAD